ncbi:transaldolase family protein [Staphylococcus aureus]|uniref:transaldolase family protein n=1 Tax=Staphylococcus aureus TaxID=1280 RepID=UPI0030D53066
MAKLNVEVFADGADIEEMKAAYKNKQVDGFTTNPSLMAKKKKKKTKTPKNPQTPKKQTTQSNTLF